MGFPVSRPPVPPSERLGQAVPASLETLILKCLAKDPAGRFAAAAELLDALRACADVPPFPISAARLWWEQRAPRILKEIRAARAAVLGKAESHAHDVAVDLTGRYEPSRRERGFIY